ncbi:MAG TPA: AAA family ATPase [Caulobacteraceae bacterium]|jgi:chromosome partitioning protein|nr:AAA family ATPase [Caulobacteraceae bacterium]
MRTLAVLSRKGGTGKTTVALHLAAAAYRDGHSTILCDMDPQRSALDWRRERRIDGPEVSEAKVGTLFTARQSAVRAGIDLMVLDTRPSSDMESAEAVRFADLCLIVVRPCYFDLKAIVRTVELVTNMNRKGLFVLNQAPVRTRGAEPRLIRETVAELEQLGLPVADGGLRFRTAYQNAVRQGLAAQEAEPESNAAIEINALWAQVSRELWPQDAVVAATVTTERERVLELG